MVTPNSSCRLCKSTEIELFLDLGAQPPANNFLRSEQLGEEEYYPLRVGLCKRCAFVQLLDVVDPDTLFRNYLYVSSTSPVFVRHFEEYARFIDDRFDVREQLIVDIGSNDGVLLAPFKALGAKVLGIDPARAIAERATQGGLETLPEYFTGVLAEEVVKKYGSAKAITMNNAFAHVDDLDEIMRGVAALLADDGVFVIEAPYLVTLLEKKLFDTVYHEHLSYIAITPLVPFFAKWGMEIVDVEDVSSHGGSVRIMVMRRGKRSIDDHVARHIEEERVKGLSDIATYKKFADEVLENRRALRELLGRIRSEGKRVAGYGAPAKGNTLLNFMKIGRETLDYIVDDSPLKQGLLTPGMHIPVVSSERLAENPPEYLLILAWNFAEPIMGKNKAFKESGGKFIIPVPNPAIV